MRIVLTSIIFLSLGTISNAQTTDQFAKKLCKEQPDMYRCIKISHPNKTYLRWEEAFPNPGDAELMIKLNRRNNGIWKYHWVAIPLRDDRNLFFYSPFSFKNYEYEKKTVVVDLKQLAWGAYENTQLLMWGPVSGGTKLCKEDGLPNCKTHSGEWTILDKTPGIRKSKKYPVTCDDTHVCGSKMWSYQIFHSSGDGIHGVKYLSGFNASHGCIRTTAEDSRWLYKFTEIGTKVIVMDY